MKGNYLFLPYKEHKMNNASIKPMLLPAAFLIFIAATTRLFPHPFNFTAIGAMALFSGANFKNKTFALLLPFIAMFLSDIVLGFHFSMAAVYACIGFTVWLGMKSSSNQNVLRLAASSLISSLVFFLITNLPFWYYDIKLYPMSLAGTLQSYTMAIPFFGNQIAGDLFYTALIFGVYRVYISARSKSIA